MMYARSPIEVMFVLHLYSFSLRDVSMLEVGAFMMTIKSDDFGRFLAFHHRGRCAKVARGRGKQDHILDDTHYYICSPFVISSSCLACISGISISGNRIIQLKCDRLLAQDPDRCLKVSCSQLCSKMKARQEFVICFYKKQKQKHLQLQRQRQQQQSS